MCESISVRAWVEELVCEWLHVSSCAWACVCVCLDVVKSKCVCGCLLLCQCVRVKLLVFAKMRVFRLMKEKENGESESNSTVCRRSLCVCVRALTNLPRGFEQKQERKRTKT